MTKSELHQQGTKMADDYLNTLHEMYSQVYGDQCGCHTCAEKEKQSVDHPEHYQGQEFEAIDIIEDYELGFNLGNALKYILRADRKGEKQEDLKKAIWYLDREFNHG